MLNKLLLESAQKVTTKFGFRNFYIHFTMTYSHFWITLFRSKPLMIFLLQNLLSILNRHVRSMVSTLWTSGRRKGKSMYHCPDYYCINWLQTFEFAYIKVLWNSFLAKYEILLLIDLISRFLQVEYHCLAHAIWRIWILYASWAS